MKFLWQGGITIKSTPHDPTGHSPSLAEPGRISFPHQCGHVLPWPKGRYVVASRAEMGSHCEKVDVRADTPDPENCLFICAFSCLPAGLLGSGVSPLGGGGRGSGSASLPGGGLSLAPLGGGSGSREASRSSLPVTSTSGEAGLDGDRALLLNGGELLLLDLLLGLGLRVAV